MSLKRSAQFVIAGAAAAGLTLGVAIVAGAVTRPGGAGTSAVAEKGGTQEPSYTASITTADNGDVTEADQSKALAALAKITADQARDAALGAVPGVAGAIELDNENGNVAYSVEVTDAAGTRVDVKVDAGNAKVLAQDTEAGAEGGGTGPGDKGGAADTADATPGGG